MHTHYATQRLRDKNKYFRKLIMYTIIEDCSPYYIRFKWEGLQEVISSISQQPLEKEEKYPGFQSQWLTKNAAIKINDMLPFKNLGLRLSRFCIFDTYPDGGAGIHKDGMANKISINIALEILDDKCITAWYDDEQFKEWPVNTTTGHSRNILRDWRKAATYPAVKTMVACPGEAVLFNTNIYHAFWNKNSANSRKVLTLRSEETPLPFDQIKKIMFAGN